MSSINNAQARHLDRPICDVLLTITLNPVHRIVGSGIVGSGIVGSGIVGSGIVGSGIVTCPAPPAAFPPPFEDFAAGT
jgi:hypothetical protein